VETEEVSRIKVPCPKCNVLCYVEKLSEHQWIATCIKPDGEEAGEIWLKLHDLKVYPFSVVMR
jgi:hypothetical protein